MSEQKSRLEMLITKQNVEKLTRAKVLVFGVGGVGGFVVEALARCFVGNITIVDNDIVKPSNLNRQIIALSSTIGKRKIDVLKNRILDINPNCNVKSIDLFVNNDTISSIDFVGYDFVVDAIDFVEGKLAIVKACQEHNIPIISCMGTGNKVNPFALKIDKISKTKICPLAKKMRKLSKDLGLDDYYVIYSIENPIYPPKNDEKCPASCAFVPSVAGLEIAGFVVKKITGFEGNGINLS